MGPESWSQSWEEFLCHGAQIPSSCSIVPFIPASGNFANGYFFHIFPLGPKMALEGFFDMALDSHYQSIGTYAKDENMFANSGKINLLSKAENPSPKFPTSGPG